MFALGAHGPEILALLAAALILDAYVGGFARSAPWMPRTERLLAGLSDGLDLRLNRAHRSPAARFRRGALAVAIVLVVALAAGQALFWVGKTLPFGWAVLLGAMTLSVGQRDRYDGATRTREALASDGLVSAREAVQSFTDRDPGSLDQHTVVRIAIESLADGFASRVMAAVLWTALLGVPGLFMVVAVHAMRSTIGAPAPRYAEFGRAVRAVERVVAWLPSRLGGLVLVVAALVSPGGHPGSALATMWRDRRGYRVNGSGWSVAAMAGALGLALGGPRHYVEATLNDPWIGAGRARATAADLRRAQQLYLTACVVNIGLVAAALAGWLIARTV
jgi:adenosylcobinamide-phosphate synthase